MGGRLNGVTVNYSESSNTLVHVALDQPNETYTKTRIAFGKRKGEEVFLIEGGLNQADMRLAEGFYFNLNKEENPQQI